MDTKKIEKSFLEIIQAIGENPEREGLKDTPQHVAKFFSEMFSGINKDPADEISSLPVEKSEGVVIVRDIPLYSFCEHHFLPFIGKVHIAYAPKNNVIASFGSLYRAVEVLSKRPQIQERFTQELCTAIFKKINPSGVSVKVEAEHLCITMRKPNAKGSSVVTICSEGEFRDRYNIL